MNQKTAHFLAAAFLVFVAGAFCAAEVWIPALVISVAAACLLLLVFIEESAEREDRESRR